MRIGVDLDGVVADFNRGWTTAWNEQHGTSLTVADVDGWDVLPTLTGLPDMGAFWAWAQDLGEGRSLFRDLTLLPGAAEGLRALAGDGHDLVVVTAKPRWAVHDTFAWLADVRFPTREVHVTEEKWTVACDVYLDDAVHVLEGYRRHRPSAVTVRVVRPWNHPVEGAVDVHDWDGIVDHVRGLAAT